MQKIGAVNITVDASPNGINNTEMNMKMIMPAAHTPWKQKRNESDAMALDFFFHSQCLLHLEFVSLIIKQQLFFAPILYLDS